jgi:hypothetical protein
MKKPAEVALGRASFCVAFAAGVQVAGLGAGCIWDRDPLLPAVGADVGFDLRSLAASTVLDDDAVFGVQDCAASAAVALKKTVRARHLAHALAGLFLRVGLGRMGSGAGARWDSVRYTPALANAAASLSAQPGVRYTPLLL